MDTLRRYYLDVVLLAGTMLSLLLRWMPDTWDFRNVYGASHWALSYEHGLLRRGLVGTLVQLWIPVLTIADVRAIAMALYVLFLLLILLAYLRIIRPKDPDGRLFGFYMIFVALPATLALSARNLGRLDLFLIVLFFLCILSIAAKKHVWTVPVLAAAAMFVHESFLVLYAPTLLLVMLFLYLDEGRERSLLRTFIFTAFAILTSFAALTLWGDPPTGIEHFWPAIQSHAAFPVTELSMRECYYSLRDHLALASPYLVDPGSMMNMLLALIILSPAGVLVWHLWGVASKRFRAEPWVGLLLKVAPLSGLALIPIATDYGRWFSAILYCHIFLMILLIERGTLRSDDLGSLNGIRFLSLFAFLFLTYVIFGPMHDWNPYPYQDKPLVSSVAISAVLVFDVLFVREVRAHRRRAGSSLPG